ncbi:MAG: chitobiase/beta-hexosaminidase C-terminal domain-containing protein [Verrucomicrobia bacterium]|nr:chitobiase/beta-hexosaminidase C-terminal domain-containing protein [Verrucomicrobiota bacterium]MCH8511193.1 chitobiase/beta-hexosaminidase C-terminal domain-containing protein [Kiritimatiellia bacterium]
MNTRNTSFFTLKIFLLGAFLIPSRFAWAEIAEITLVDQVTTRAEVLFRHPNAELLVLRSPRHGGLQSLPLNQIHMIRSQGGEQTFHPQRDLTEAELQERERNTLWAVETTEGTLGRWSEETWVPRPAIVWARPGESGNAMEAQNWLNERGEVLTESPWEEEATGGRRGVDRHNGRFDGDILLPAADEEYSAIQPGNRDHLGAYMIRHLTVERNASYNVRYTITGNLWVKDGAHLGAGTQTGGFGNREGREHTFMRFCNYFDLPEPRSGYVRDITHWVHIDTGEHSSLEVIGVNGGPSDRLTFSRGTLIIAEDSFIGNGNRGSFYSREGTTTILLDGAGMGCPTPMVTSNMGTYGIDGTLMFGTPERPLTRDLLFEGAYFRPERVNPNATPSQRTSGASFVLGPNGRMVVHSEDPTRARVVFRPRSRLQPNPSVDPWHSRFVHRGRPADPELWEQPGVPTGVYAVFRGETDFDGVVFDGFYKGGILMNVEDAANWRNVEFGPDNHGPPHSLFAHLPGPELAGEAAVQIEPEGGQFLAGKITRIHLRPARDNFRIRYTLDGSVPDRESPESTGPLELAETTTVTAGAFLDNVLFGLPVAAEFVFQRNPNHAPLAKISATASFGRNPPTFANDLDELTYWRGGTQDLQYLTLEWEEPVVFNHLKVMGRPVNSWKLQAEVEGNWVDVSSGNEFPVDVRFEEITSARVRLEIEIRGDRPQVNQIEVIQVLD